MRKYLQISGIVLFSVFLLVLDRVNINNKEYAENKVREQLQELYLNVEQLALHHSDILKIQYFDKKTIHQLLSWGIVDVNEPAFAGTSSGTGKKIIVNSTGWYWVIKKNNSLFVVKIKYLYGLNNRYLEEHYLPCLHLSKDYKLEYSATSHFFLNKINEYLPLSLSQFPKYKNSFLLDFNAVLYVIWFSYLLIILFLNFKSYVIRLWMVCFVMALKWLIQYFNVLHLLKESFLYNVEVYAFSDLLVFDYFGDVILVVIFYGILVFFTRKESRVGVTVWNVFTGNGLLLLLIYLFINHASFTLDINDVLFYKYSYWFYTIVAMLCILFLTVTCSYLILSKIVKTTSMLKAGMVYFIYFVVVVWIIFFLSNNAMQKKTEIVFNWLENIEQLALYEQVQIIDRNLNNLKHFNDSIYFDKIEHIEKSSVYLQLSQRFLLEDSIQLRTYLKGKRPLLNDIFVDRFSLSSASNNYLVYYINYLDNRYLVSVFEYTLPFSDKSFFSFLSDKIFQVPSAFKNFSIGCYEQNNLKFKLGNSIYPTSIPEMSFIEKLYPTHNFVFRSTSDKTFILSFPKRNFQYFITLFSIYFIFAITLVFFIAYIYFVVSFKQIVFLNKLSYLYKIPALMIVIWLFSFYFLFYFTYQSVVKQLKNSINIELIKKIHSFAFGGDKDEWNNSVFLFNNNGIISEKSMNNPLFRLKLIPIYLPDHLMHQINEKKNVFIKRQIGNYSFTSLLSFSNLNSDKVIFEIPYFDEQQFLENNLYSALNPLFSIYAFLFLMSFFISIILSNYLIVPIQRISKHLKNNLHSLSLKTIQYSAEDEIGELVKNYNILVVRLQDALEQLKKEQQEKAWKLMAQQVAHDIKNSLTPLLLNIEYLMKQSDLESRSQTLLNSILQQIQLLSRIAEDFSEFAQDFNVKIERVNLSLLIEEILRHYSGFENVEFRFNKNGKKFDIDIDVHLLRRVLMNLINNSIESFQENGKIEIRLNELENAYEISISDNGCGILDEIKDKIFEPHFSTKTSGKGLGLSIVKRICDKLNIVIRFESQKNQGTQFFLHIPKK